MALRFWIRGLVPVLLILIGLTHTVVGLTGGRKLLLEIAREGFWNTAQPGSAPISRPLLLWFLVSGFFLLMLGHLAFWVERRANRPLPRALGVELILFGVILGVVTGGALPAWLFAAAGIYVLLVARAGVLSLLLLMLGTVVEAAPNAADYFTIKVVDEQTGRGVPLVELRTTNGIRFYTDSNGIVALYEPGLMDQTVYFHIRSHGYEFQKDPFGNRGKALQVAPGKSALIKIKRVNIAERLYRITGQGIYRDSLLVGHPVPLENPVLNGQVAGQDSVVVAPYRNKLYWFWGDTGRFAYPLGHFAVSGATSELPGKGGLDPNQGVNLSYFVDESGFSRPVCNIGGPGLKWLFWTMTARDESGTERLIARYRSMKGLGEQIEGGLVKFNDTSASFERLVRFDVDIDNQVSGQPFAAIVNSMEYRYIGLPFPNLRVRADWKNLINPRSYEAFSCLVPGSRYQKSSPKLDRDSDGRLIYRWKQDTAALNSTQEEQLVSAGLIGPDEALFQLRDFDSGAPIKGHAGSVCWNNYRRRWVMIVQEDRGLADNGEIWYAEADTTVGPWVYARKVVTHDKYTFYNPLQHCFFAQDGGRLIYFEGTYSDFFSGSPEKTPWYDYNQIMYRLALDDPRLSLPVPVYQVAGAGGTKQLLLRESVGNRWGAVEKIAFFAFPPDRRPEHLIPFPAGRPVFYALPPAEAAPKRDLTGTWNFKAKAIDEEHELSLDLRQEGTEVTSWVEDPKVSGAFIDGRLQLTLAFNEFGTYLLTANFVSDKLTGEWKSKDGSESGTFTASRAEAGPDWSASPQVVPLYEHRAGRRVLYSTESRIDGMVRSREPVARVWRNPMSLLLIDPEAKPVGGQ